MIDEVFSEANTSSITSNGVLGDRDPVSQRVGARVCQSVTAW